MAAERPSTSRRCKPVTPDGGGTQPLQKGRRGAASQADLSDLTARVTEAESKLTVLWDAVFTNITGNPFTVTFETLDGVTVEGVWNTESKRIEF